MSVEHLMPNWLLFLWGDSSSNSKKIVRFSSVSFKIFYHLSFLSFLHFTRMYRKKTLSLFILLSTQPAHHWMQKFFSPWIFPGSHLCFIYILFGDGNVNFNLSFIPLKFFFILPKYLPFWSVFFFVLTLLHQCTFISCLLRSHFLKFPWFNRVTTLLVFWLQYLLLLSFHRC